MANTQLVPGRAADDGLDPLHVAQNILARAEQRFSPKSEPNQPPKADRLRALLAELVVLAEATPAGLQTARRKPALPLLLVALGFSILCLLVLNVEIPKVEIGPRVAAPDALQGLEALANLSLLLFGGLLGAIKLREALALKELRSRIRPIRELADRLYFLQIDKDAERICRSASGNTKDSPKSGLTLFELHRYLFYLRSALAVLSRLASQYSDAAATDEGAELAGDLAERIRDLNSEVDCKYQRVDDRLYPLLVAQGAGSASAPMPGTGVVPEGKTKAVIP